MRYQNPVIPGFYPDPSVCRAGNDYYLVNSSFEFFPGVPLYHSKDLVNWEQIGHVLTRESQLPLKDARTSGGIFAPTIRCHNGRFYMVTTNVTGGGHFYVWTDNVYGEWSDPIWIKTEQFGIDPSLFWDDDGKVYFQGTFFDVGTGRQCIGQCELDLSTGRQIGKMKPIWFGTGGKCPEGPHLYKINGLYYLMIAEGGTEYGHMETIARSDSPWGPFESCPENPILTHRDFTPDYARINDPDYVNFQGLGHADLIDDPQGNWWLVFHGIRPSQSMLHHIGRETMLAPVTWRDGWPVVNGGKDIDAVMEGPGNETEQPDWFFTEDFTKLTVLPPRWAFLRNPVAEHYRLEDGLTLTAGEETLDGNGSPTFLGVRQRHFHVQATAVLEFSPAEEAVEAGLTVFHTNEHHYDLIVTRRGGKRAAVLRRTVGDMQVESAPVTLPDEGKLTLRVEAEKLAYRFYAGGAEDALALIGQGRSQLLSTEMMLGTFTGCFIGLFAQGQPGAKAKFCKLNYVNDKS